MQTIKNNIDTLSLLNRMLDSARKRVNDPDINQYYLDLLNKAIPDLEERIRNLKVSIEQIKNKSKKL